MPWTKSGDGIEIYYEAHGAPDGGAPCLVFAHGAGGNATSWFQQVPAFAPTHRVAVFDHRGFGRSVCPPERQSAAKFEDDLAAVMDAAGMDTATVVCQSMGGWTGVRAAVNLTHRVDAVFLANTPGAVRNEVTRRNFEQMSRRLAEAGGLVNRAYSERFAERKPELALLYRQISAFNTQARPNIRDDAVYVAAGDVKASGVRFHMLSSDLDPLFPPEVLASVAADIDAPVTHIEGAGHSTYFEMPDAFNDALRDFLAG